MDTSSIALAIVSSWALQFVLYHGYKLYNRFSTYENRFQEKTDVLVKSMEKKIEDFQQKAETFSKTIESKLENLESVFNEKTRLLTSDNRSFLNQVLSELKGKTADGYKTCLGLMSDTHQAEIVNRMLSNHETLSEHYMNIIDATMRTRSESCTVPRSAQPPLTADAPFSVRNTKEEKNKRVEEVKMGGKDVLGRDDLVKKENPEIPVAVKIQDVRALFSGAKDDEDLVNIEDKDLMSGVVYYNESYPQLNKETNK